MTPVLNLSPRRKRLVLWVALAVLAGVVLWLARAVLLPYILGLVLAYLLLPVVNWLDGHMPRKLRTWGAARPLSIVVTYLVLISIVVGIFAFFVPLVIDQAEHLRGNWPQLSGEVQDLWQDSLGWYTKNIPDEWEQTIETNLRDLADDVVSAVQRGIVATVQTVAGTVGFVIGLIVIPFWLFYILHDESQLKTGVANAVPEQARADATCAVRLIDDILSAYIRGQLLLVLFVGGMATIAMFIIGVPFALVLGLIAGLFEILPYIGPILGAIPAILVALVSDPISALWVAVAFFAIQQVENLILVPRIAGESVQLHPAVVMVVLVMGNELGGFLGMIIAVPITAIIRDIFKYAYLRLLDDPVEPEEAMSRVRSGQDIRLSV
ncbi:MAG: AI-2E family transporter [Anaerolineae bacterium]|nr:AI-2E family transporter [Anaerolineae bacterium]